MNTAIFAIGFLLFVIGMLALVYVGKRNRKKMGGEELKVLEITCKYCGHKWVEKPKAVFEDLGNKFQQAGQELARPLFPWTPIEKKDKKRCPKCGSEIFSSRLIELRD